MEVSYPNCGNETFNIKIEAIDPNDNSSLNMCGLEELKYLKNDSSAVDEKESHEEQSESNGSIYVFTNEIKEFEPYERGPEDIVREHFDSGKNSSKTIKIEQHDPTVDVTVNVLENSIADKDKTKLLEMMEDVIIVKNENLNESEHMSVKLQEDNIEKQTDNIHVDQGLLFPCLFCSKAFKRKSDLNDHCSLHTGQKLHLCKICSELFLTSSQLSKHRAEVHAEDTEWVCTSCSGTFESKRKLSLHMKVFHSMDKPSLLQCEICFAEFKAQEELEEHDESVHGRKNKNTCVFCGMNLKYPSDLKRHERKHTGFRPFICDICSKSYLTANQLLKHIQKHKQVNAGEKWFKCNTCDKGFLSDGDLKRHLRRVHKAVIPFTCQICKEQLPTRELHQKHKREIHGVKLAPAKEKQLLECDSCLKKFKFPCDLKRHMLTHSSDKPYKCEKCSLTFKMSWNYNRHVAGRLCEKSKLKHSNMKTEKQEEKACPYCLKWFKKSGLNAHIAINHKDNYPCKRCGDVFANRELLLAHRESMHHKVWPCDQCDKIFQVKQMLENHARTHTKEQPFLCHICAAQFTQKVHLMSHISCHDGKNCPKIDCLQCSKTFRRQYDLKRHLKKYHGIEKDKTSNDENLEQINEEAVQEMIDIAEETTEETLEFYDENSELIDKSVNEIMKSVDD